MFHPIKGQQVSKKVSRMLPLKLCRIADSSVSKMHSNVGFPRAVPARPIPNFGCSSPSHPFARFLACPVVPLSGDNEGTSVPMTRKVTMSHPVGNATLR